MTTSYVGTLSVSALSLGVTLALPELTLRLGELTDLKAELQAKIDDITLKLGLIADVSIPNPVSLALGLNAALAGVAQIAVQFPLATVSIGASLQADIDATLALMVAIDLKISLVTAILADLTLALSGGGIAAYAYEGRADRLGSELGSALAGGLPGGGGHSQTINGLLLACSSPSDWAKLGVVLKVE